MSIKASGTFDVTTHREPPYDAGEGATLGRASIEKRFHGGIEGTSTVEMISAITSVQGSAGYVAMERVSASVHGRKGTFVLQHHGLMTRGKPELIVSVVPDSGTGELVGIAGSMTIEIVEDKHLYTFDYALD